MFLDPRFKLTRLTNQDARETLKRRVKEEMQQLAETGVSPATNVQDNSSEPTKKVYKTAWGEIFANQQTGNGSTSESSTDRAEKEWESYVHCPLLDTESSPLEWWKLQHKQFPLLAKMVQKYLSACATSVPSERVFSTGGHVVHGRSRLKPEKVNKLIFLAENLKLDS